MLRPGDSHQSSQDNSDGVSLDTAGAGFSPQSEEESFASESLSPASDDGAEDFSLDMKRMVHSDMNISYYEAAVQYKRHDTFSLQKDLSTKNLDGLDVTQAHDSLKLAAKRGNSEKDEAGKQRRGTRKRKPKVPFEEELVSRKPKKKLRQMRIMRHLGLAAPHGSPFTSACVVRSAA